MSLARQVLVLNLWFLFLEVREGWSSVRPVTGNDVRAAPTATVVDRWKFDRYTRAWGVKKIHEATLQPCRSLHLQVSVCYFLSHTVRTAPPPTPPVVLVANACPRERKSVPRYTCITPRMCVTTSPGANGVCYFAWPAARGRKTPN